MGALALERPRVSFGRRRRTASPCASTTPISPTKPWSRSSRGATRTHSRSSTTGCSRIAYGLALRVLRDERHAEDAVQEAFLQVWRNAATFRAERAKASTWILTLVHRRAVDLVRREERRARSR